jgi:hypothetical protein
VDSRPKPVTPVDSRPKPVTPVDSRPKPVTPVDSSTKPVTPVDSSTKPVTPVDSSTKPSIFFKVVRMDGTAPVSGGINAADKGRHLPASLQRGAQRVEPVAKKLAPVFAKTVTGGKGSADDGSRSGVYRCSDSGKLYYRHRDGRVSPRE